MIDSSAQHPAVPYDQGINEYDVQEQAQVFGPPAAVSINLSFLLTYIFN